MVIVLIIKVVALYQVCFPHKAPKERMNLYITELITLFLNCEITVIFYIATKLLFVVDFLNFRYFQENILEK